MKNKFCVIQRKVDLPNGKRVIKTFMAIKFSDTDILFPHPVTKFISQKYEKRNLSLNTIKSYSEDLKGFLNHLIDFEENIGLTSLKVNHAIKYLNFLNERISKGQLKKSSYKRKEIVLEEFYLWLSESNYISDQIETNIYKNIFNGDSFLKVKKSIFSHPKYSLITANEVKNEKFLDSEVVHDFPKNRIEYIHTFLEFTLSLTPEIAFGVALQFLGGLRKGEVVNLTINAFPKEIHKSDPYFIIKIKDRYEEIFGDRKRSYVHEQVKVSRDQLILNLGIVYEIYELHMKRRASFNPESQAMFTSNHSQIPISGQMYTKKFNYVKKVFLDYLLVKDRYVYEYLRQHEWSSHFGRGVFTNFLIQDLGWGAEEVRLMRGDKNLTSTQAYIDKIMLINNAKKVLDIIPKIMEQEDIARISSIGEIVKKIRGD